MHKNAGMVEKVTIPALKFAVGFTQLIITDF
jgi:hypothetical protein